MRAINIKKIHYTQLYYVLAVLLLLSWGSRATKEVERNQAKLIKNAQLQQQKLIKAYGLSQRPEWQKKCQALISTLKLNRFKRCWILKASFANAYSLAHGSVILTKGLLENINNDDQLAHILAHEHAHLTLNHHQQAQRLVANPPKFFTKSRIKKFYRRLEQQADEAADEWLLTFNRDPLQIHHYLLRIEKLSHEHSTDHQKIKDRLQREGLPVEAVEVFWSHE